MEKISYLKQYKDGEFLIKDELARKLEVRSSPKMRLLKSERKISTKTHNLNTEIMNST